MKNPHAVALGRLGGKVKSPKKALSSRKNGMKAKDTVHAYMKALGKEKLNVETWKKLAKVNRDILDTEKRDL